MGSLKNSSVPKAEGLSGHPGEEYQQRDFSAFTGSRTGPQGIFAPQLERSCSRVPNLAWKAMTVSLLVPHQVQAGMGRRLAKSERIANLPLPRSQRNGRGMRRCPAGRRHSLSDAELFADRAGHMVKCACGTSNYSFGRSNCSVKELRQTVDCCSRPILGTILAGISIV